MPVESELKLGVPASRRAAVTTAMRRGQAAPLRGRLQAVYFDTPDARLARAGLSWRVRREGRRWVQTLKSTGHGLLGRMEHSVPVQAGPPDPRLHAGTAAGERLLATLSDALRADLEPMARYEVDVRRLTRRIRTRGAVVEVALDIGTVSARGRSQPISELEFERISGPMTAVLQLAQRWRRQLGLIIEMRSKAERGDALARDVASPEVRKARVPAYARDISATQAFGIAVDECLAQVLTNAGGLLGGGDAAAVDHVHQLRVGIRRLRSALRTFAGWAPPPPEDLVDGMRRLFAQLGQVRDRDVLAGGVVAALVAAGAPAPPLPAPAVVPDPRALVMSDAVQDLFMGWLVWRCTLEEGADGRTTGGHSLAAADDDGESLGWMARRRLARWHRRMAAQIGRLAELDDEALHALRRRVKRQRYAVEFLAPVLRRHEAERYLDVLAPAQEALGGLNDLFVARDLYQAASADQPATWFAMGWLAARIAAVKISIAAPLQALAAAAVPKARGWKRPS